MRIKKLCILNSPRLDSLENHDLLDYVFKNAEVKREDKRYIPISFLFIITDGHDIINFKKQNGHDCINIVTIPEFKKFRKPKKEIAFVLANDTGLNHLQEIFNIKSSFKIKDLMKVINTPLAIKLLDCIVLPRIIYINNIDRVKLTPKLKGYESISSISINDLVNDDMKKLYLDDDEYKSIFNFNPLDLLLVNHIVNGGIMIPNKNINTSFPEA